MTDQRLTELNSRYSRARTKGNIKSQSSEFNIIKLIETLFWWAFLCLLAYSGFIQPVYASQSWLQFSAILYSFSGLYLCYVLMGGSPNIQAFEAAKWSIILLVLALFWLGIQIIWPFQVEASSQFIFDLQLGAASEAERLQIPAWFSPDLTWSLVPSETQSLLMSRLMCLIVFCLTLLLCDSRVRVRQVLIVILLVGLVHAFSGIFAKYMNLLLVERKQVDGHFSAARGWFINRNHFAAFISLTMVTPIAFILKKLMRDKSDSTFGLAKSIIFVPQVFFCLSLLVGIFAMVVSQSRAGFLALPLAIALICVLNLSELKKVAGFHRALMVITFVIVFVVVIFGQEMVSRLANGFLSVGERGIQWAITWQAIKEQWFVGYGGGSYATVFQIIREHAPLREVIYDQSHSYYLHLWLEQGLVGLLLWLSFVGLAFLTAYKALKNSTSTMLRSLQFACIIVLISALMQSFVDFNLQILNIRLYFFVIIALIYCGTNLRKRRHSSRPK